VAAKRTKRTTSRRGKATTPKKKATRRQLAAWVAERSDLSYRRAYALVGEVLSGIAEALVAGGTVELRGFGTFWVNERGPRTIQVPGVGPVKVGKRRDVLFRPGEPLEQRVRKTRRRRG
jgi:nucleoid DNA-binding protein